MTSTDRDCCNHGDRLPAAFVLKHKILLFYAMNFSHQYNFELNTLYHVKIKQEKIVRSMSGRFCIWINEQKVICKQTGLMKIFDNVRLYLSDPWYDGFKSYGKLTNMEVTNLGMKKHYFEEKIVSYSF